MVSARVLGACQRAHRFDCCCACAATPACPVPCAVREQEANKLMKQRGFKHSEQLAMAIKVRGVHRKQHPDDVACCS